MKKNNYFDESVEQHIVDYQKIKSVKEKQNYFIDHLYEPFKELIYGIIKAYKFEYIKDTLEDLTQEGIAFLLDRRLDMFKPEYGTKAYSYFGTALKRYFIVRNAECYKKQKSHVCIDALPQDSFYLEDDEDTSDGYVTSFIETLSRKIDKEFKYDHPEEYETAKKILIEWKNTDNITLFKKSSLYNYMHTKYGTPASVTSKVIDIFKGNTTIS